MPRAEEVKLSGFEFRPFGRARDGKTNKIDPEVIEKRRLFGPKKYGRIYIYIEEVVSSLMNSVIFFEFFFLRKSQILRHAQMTVKFIFSVKVSSNCPVEYSGILPRL